LISDTSSLPSGETAQHHHRSSKYDWRAGNQNLLPTQNDEMASLFAIDEKFHTGPDDTALDRLPTSYRTGRTPVGDLKRFAVAAVAIWMLITVLRAVPAENQPASGNTLVIPSLIKIHRHHRHHREPVQPFPKLD
jgi:hypothetical protein